MIKHCKPIITPILKLFFPIRKETIITWGDTIYVEKGVIMKEDVRQHELVHIKQQKSSKWYGLWFMIRFITSKMFRTEVELEAFKAQYKYICDNGYDKKFHLRLMANELSSELYGSMMSYGGAIKLIKKQ